MALFLTLNSGRNSLGQMAGLEFRRKGASMWSVNEAWQNQVIHFLPRAVCETEPLTMQQQQQGQRQQQR